MLHVGIVALTTGDAGVSALVGNNVMPVLLNEGCALPALTFQLAGGRSDPTFATSGMQRARYQFDAHGKTYASCAAVMAALRTLLDGFVGTLTDGTRVLNCEWIQQIDHYDYEPLQFRISAEFYFDFCLT
jgi:hypothetical protein